MYWSERTVFFSPPELSSSSHETRAASPAGVRTYVVRSDPGPRRGRVDAFWLATQSRKGMETGAAITLRFVANSSSTSGSRAKSLMKSLRTSGST